MAGQGEKTREDKRVRTVRIPKRPLSPTERTTRPIPKKVETIRIRNAGPHARPPRLKRQENHLTNGIPIILKRHPSALNLEPERFPASEGGLHKRNKKPLQVMFHQSDKEFNHFL